MPRAGTFLPSWPLLALVAALAAAFARADALLGDPDTQFHIVIGRWIVANLAVPRADFLSHSIPGTPWVVHEWLAEVAMALLHDRLGWWALVAASGLTLGASLAILARALLRRLEPLHALIAVAFAWALLMPHWLARPHGFALPVLALWIALVVEARERDRTPPAAAALLMALWVNLHASFMTGLGIAGLLAAEAVLAAPDWAGRRRQALRWAGFLTLAVLATFANPIGPAIYLLPFHLLDMQFALSVVTEWRPSEFGTLQPMELWLLGLLALAFGLGLRLPWMRLAILLLLVHLALKHARHADLLALTAPLLMAPALAAQLPRSAPSGGLDRLVQGLAPPAARAGAAVAAALVAVLCLLGAWLDPHPPARAMPRAAIEAALAAGARGPVFNEYGFGGTLIYSGIAPFIDGRTDLYGDALVERAYRAVTTGEGLAALLESYRIGWTLLPPGSAGAAAMDRMPGWRRVHADPVAVVHLRAP